MFATQTSTRRGTYGNDAMQRLSIPTVHTYVCVHYVCTYICTYSLVYVCTHVRTYVQCTYIPVYIRMYALHISVPFLHTYVHI